MTSSNTNQAVAGMAGVGANSMGTPGASAGTSMFKPFSIANFRELFENSESRKYMSDMEVRQVSVAIEEKDVMLLGKLYEILLLEQATGQEIISDFATTKNRIVDGFMAEATHIRKKFVEKPQEERRAEQEASEQVAAEKLIGTLNNNK